MGKEISEAAFAHLTRWTAYKPTMALMGEFSAGKSTLLNLLLDTDVLPTKVTATILPAVFLTWAEAPFMQGLRHDGTLEDVAFDDLDDTVRETYLLLRIGSPAVALRTCNMVDTPGISDPKLAKGATAYLGQYLDFVVWCSPANQAWRQTEKTVWSAFPEHLRAQSLLVMTRADKLRRASDLDKVLKRARRETGDMFRLVLPLDTPRAAASGRRGADWDASGGAAFQSALEASFAAISKASPVDLPPDPEETLEEAIATPTDVSVATDTGAAGSEVAAAPVAEPEIADDEVKAPAAPAIAEDPAPQIDASPESAPATASTPKPKRKTTKVATLPSTGILAAFDAGLCENGQFTCHAELTSFLGQFVARLAGNKDLNPTQRFVIQQCLSAGDDPTVDVERLIEQVRKDLTDFDQDSWCVLVAA